MEVWLRLFNPQRTASLLKSSRKFKNLSTTQMMDFLSRDLVHWQQMITEPTDKSPK